MLRWPLLEGRGSRLRANRRRGQDGAVELQMLNLMMLLVHMSLHTVYGRVCFACTYQVGLTTCKFRN